LLNLVGFSTFCISTGGERGSWIFMEMPVNTAILMPVLK